MKFDTSKTASIVLLFVILSFATRWLSLAVEIVDMDEAAHIVGSWQLMNGKLLYTDFVDNKPPLIYAYYALAQIVFGRGLFAVHLFTILIAIPAIAWGVHAFYGRSLQGLVASLLFLLFSAAFLAHDMLASNTEILMLLPGVWALVLVSTAERAMQPARIAAASFLIGTGVLCKQQVAFWLPAIAIAVAIECIRNRNYRRLLLLAAVSLIGFVTPLLIAYLLFRMRNGEQAMLYWTITNNLLYAANPIGAKEALGRAASYLLPFLVVTSPLWYYAARSRALHESGYRRRLVTGLVLFSIPPVCIGFRFFPHYFIQLYVPLALAAAPYAAQLWQQNRARGFVSYSLILVALCTLMNAYLYVGKSNVYREQDPVYRNVSAELRRLPCYNGASLFVWGYSPELYYHAGLPIASRFALMSQSGLTGYISGNLSHVRNAANRGKVLRPESWTELLNDLEKNRCTYIIDTAPAGIRRWDQFPIADYPLLQDYIRKRYELVSTVEQVAIYQRKDCS